MWLCGGSARVRWRLACPSSLLDPPCGAARALLLRAGCSRPWGRVGVPPILGHAGGGVHFPGPYGTRQWRDFGVRLRRFWADLSDVWTGVSVQTNTVRNGLVRTASLLAGAAHTRAVMRIITAHLCDSARGRGRMCRASISTQIAAMLSVPIQAKPGPRFQRGRPTQQHSPAVGQLLMTSI